MNKYKVDIFLISLGLSVVSALIILSFRDFFIYVPFLGGFSLFTFLGFTALIGWISLLILPPLFFRDTKKWSVKQNILLIVSVSLFTASTIGIKIHSLVTFGTIYAEYLVLYPALFFIEWLLPIFYIFVSVRLSKTRNDLERSSKNAVTREFSEA